MSVSTQQTSDPLSKTGIEDLYAAAFAPPAAPDYTEIIKFRESEQGKALASWVHNKFTRCKGLRSSTEQQWNLNLAFYNGNQWVNKYTGRSPNAGKLGPMASASNYRERQTINRIKPIIRTEMAKFISQRPGASVIPATDEDEDILAAEAGEQVWVSTSNRRNLDEEIADAVFWMCITGNGFIKVRWIDDLMDADSEQMGDIEYGSVDPYKLFFPDLKTKSIQAQPFIIHAYAKPLEWLELNFKDVLNGTKLTTSCREADSITSESFASSKDAGKEQAYDSCMLYEVWIKPGHCKYMPNGGLVTLIDDIIVEYKPDGIPYTHGEYPFAHLPHIKSDGFYRTSIIDDLIDLNRDYNKLRSQIAESRKKMAKPQLTAQKGAVSVAKITNEIGVLIEYKAGMQAPQPLPLQNIPNYVMQEVEFILRDMEDISGQHEVSKGGTPPGVTAATAISYLQESDDSYILPSFKGVEAAYGSIARQTLKLCVQYWDQPRMVKVVGKDDAFSTMLLEGADLQRATDIRIEPGSSLPQSKAARQSFVMDLMTNGFVDPNDGLDMLEIGGAKKLIDNIKNDKRQAQRENIKFKRLTDQDIADYQQAFDNYVAQQPGGELLDPNTGQPMQAPLIIPVNDWDNHAVHIEEHNRFRRTQEFETMGAGIRSAIQAHVEQHKAQQQQDMVTQAMGAIPSDGSIPDISSLPAQGGAEPGPSPSGDLSNSGIVPPESPSAAHSDLTSAPPTASEQSNGVV